MSAITSESAVPRTEPSTEEHSAVADVAGARIAGRFRLGSRIDRGSGRPVWRAHDERLEREVAFKRLAPGTPSGRTAGADLPGTASAVASLSSPHLVRVLDVGRDDVGLFVVMELVKGPTLAALAEHGPLPWEVVAAVGCQVARGLAAAHRGGITHGELGLGNVLIGDPSGFVKLNTLGSSPTIAPPAPDAGRRARYLPLEVALDRLDGPGSAADDLHGLGLLLRDCLAGVSNRHAGRERGPAPRPSAVTELARADVPPELRSIVGTLTRREMNGRLADATAVAEALQDIVGSRPWGVTAEHLKRVRSSEDHTRPLEATAGREAPDPASASRREGVALQLAAMAFTQAVTGQRDPRALAAVAGDHPQALVRAREVLSDISLEDEHHRRLAEELLLAASAVPARVTPRRPAPVDDPGRLEAIRASGLLDSPIEEVFDRVSRLATRVLGTPVSLVSIVNGDRQFFKSQVGLPEPWASSRGTPIGHSFCRYVAETDHPLAIADARHHPLVAENGAIADLSVIAYLGVPVHDVRGTVLGSFCVISDEPRQWTDGDLAVLGDLAAIVQRELHIREAASELEHEASSAREAMATLAHDLRAPLGVVTSGVESIRRLQPDVPAPVGQLLDAMARQANRTLAIASAILEEQRPTTADHGSVDLRGIVEELLQDGVLPAGARERVQVDIPAGLRLAGSPVLIEQIVVNLVTNALQHTDGEVEVRAERRPGGHLELRVLDRGPGLSAGDLASLTRPHVRGERSAGYGLGLALVRRFVDRLSGQLRIDDRSGAPGTVFVVTLPDAGAGDGDEAR